MTKIYNTYSVVLKHSVTGELYFLDKEFLTIQEAKACEWNWFSGQFSDYEFFGITTNHLDSPILLDTEEV